jgi:aconitate hydratase
VKAVIAESFERIHRANLVGMGVLPLVFKNGQDRTTLGLTGEEVFEIAVDESLKPGQDVTVKAGAITFDTTCRIDTPVELEYYRNGGILQTVLRKMLKGAV